jgi:hypothetical protein
MALATISIARRMTTSPQLLKSFGGKPATHRTGASAPAPSTSAPFGQTETAAPSLDSDTTQAQRSPSRSFFDLSRGQRSYGPSHITAEEEAQWRTLLAQAGLGDLKFPPGVMLCQAWRDFLADLAKRQQTDDAARWSTERGTTTRLDFGKRNGSP